MTVFCDYPLSLDQSKSNPRTLRVPIPKSIFRFFQFDDPKRSKRIHQSTTAALLVNGRLRFSDPVGFNDPFDSLASFEGLITEHQAKQGKMHLSPKDISYEAMSYHRAIFTKSLRIVCFSANHKNSLLWSHYARNHEGFAVEFSTEAELFQRYLKRVIYTNKRPNIRSKNYDRILLSKSPAWRYESEWRMICPLKELIEDPAGIYSINLQPTSIRKIYVGIKITTENRTSLDRFSQKYRVEIIQMKPSISTYNLEESD